MPRKEQTCSSTLSLTSALDGGVWLTPRPSRFTPAREIQCPVYRRLCGPQSRSGQVWKTSPPPGFDPPDRPARNESLCPNFTCSLVSKSNFTFAFLVFNSLVSHTMGNGAL